MQKHRRRRREDALDWRQVLGYALLELRVLQLHRRLLELDIEAYEYRVRKSDIHLCSVFYQLAVSFSKSGNTSCISRSLLLAENGQEHWLAGQSNSEWRR
jgi:hypothetical protein